MNFSRVKAIPIQDWWFLVAGFLIGIVGGICGMSFWVMIAVSGLVGWLGGYFKK